MMRILMLAIGFGLLLIVWENSASVFPDVKFFLSSPLDSMKFAVSDFDSLWNPTLTTAIEAIGGFGLAIIVSFLFILLSLYWPSLLRALLPIFVASQILPMITLAPLFIILFGMGIASKIAMVALMCFFPIFINFAVGIKNISPNILELLYIYNAGRTFRIFKVLIPLSLPQVFVGLKVSTTMAIMGAVVAEFMGTKEGLGKNLYLAPKNSQPELMICSIILIIILGFLFFKAVEFGEQFSCKWHCLKNETDT